MNLRSSKPGALIQHKFKIEAMSAILSLIVLISHPGCKESPATISPEQSNGTLTVSAVCSETFEEITGAVIILGSDTTVEKTPSTFNLLPGGYTVSAYLSDYIGTPIQVNIQRGVKERVTLQLTPKEILTSAQQGKIDPSGHQFTLTYTQFATLAFPNAQLTERVTVSDILSAAMANGKTLWWKEDPVSTEPRKVLADLESKVSVAAWSWDAVDQEAGLDLTTSTWIPQGITTSHDASDDGLYEGKKVAVVSWYGKPETKGLRLSFFEIPNEGKNGRYIDVVLARHVTENGNLRLMPILYDGPGFVIKEHEAGGIAWYGDRIFVASANGGFHVFDLKNIYRLPDSIDVHSASKKGVGEQALYESDFDFVMLEVGKTSQHGKCTRTPQAVGDPICFSSVSLDRSTLPHSLVTAEYRSKDEMKHSKVGVRIVRWNLDPNGLLSGASSATITSSGTFLTPTKYIQGALISSVNRFYLSTTGKDPTFYYEKDGDGVDPKMMPWPTGGEAICISLLENRIWSLTERPGLRMVFWVRVDEMERGSR